MGCGLSWGGCEMLKPYPCLFCQLFKGFSKIQPVDAAVKIENITRSLTTEAVKRSLLFVDGERRFRFLMERAGSNQTGTDRTQLNISTDEICDIDTAFYGLNGIAV